MNKKIIFLLMLGIIIFIIAVFCINAVIKRYEAESLTSSAAPIIKKNEQVSDIAVNERGEKQELNKQVEEPEKELPIQSAEPLLN